MARLSVVPFGAFLDIAARIAGESRLGRPSVVEEALAKIEQPNYRWVRDGMRDYLTAPEASRAVSGQESTTEAAPVDRRVHNHGPEEGPGLACREMNVYGRLLGHCLIDEA